MSALPAGTPAARLDHIFRELEGILGLQQDPWSSAPPETRLLQLLRERLDRLRRIEAGMVAEDVYEAHAHAVIWKQMNDNPMVDKKGLPSPTISGWLLMLVGEVGRLRADLAEARGALQRLLLGTSHGAGCWMDDHGWHCGEGCQQGARQCGAALELEEVRRELARLRTAPLPEVAERIRRDLQPYLDARDTDGFTDMVEELLDLVGKYERSGARAADTPDTGDSPC